MTENKTTEFKREYTEDIKYAVIAFANTDGGSVYIGIDDNGSVYGVEKADETMVRVTNMLRDAIKPDVTMFTDVSVQKRDNKEIIVITVQRGTARPYYIKGKGIRPEGVYIRHGASSIPASETKILELIKETSGDKFEDAISLNQQLTFNETSKYFARRNIDFGKSQMKTLGLLNQDDVYTNLAMLFSDQCGNTIKMAAFEGSRKTIFKDRKELTGSILFQMEQAFSFIEQYNRTRSEFSGLYRIDKKDYPVEAMREALLNSIVHRDYSYSGPTLISVFDNRIEFINIGGLVRGISYDDIMLGISATRNSKLANIFYRLKLIEAYGTGMLKINECYAETNVKPQVEVTNNAFKITLPNVNYIKEAPNIPEKQFDNIDIKQTDRENKILKLLKNKDFIVRKDVETELKVSQATAINILNQMINKNLVVKTGAGKNQKYTLK